MKYNEKHNANLFFAKYIFVSNFKTDEFISIKYTNIVAVVFAYTEQIFVVVNNPIKPLLLVGGKQCNTYSSRRRGLSVGGIAFLLETYQDL